MMPSVSLSAAVAIVLDDLAQQLRLALRPAAWTSHPAAVKAARIASRRLREAVQFSAPWLLPKRAKQMADEIGWLMRPLGHLRDLDVLRELSEAHQLPAHLQDRLTAERADAERAVNARLAMARVHRMFAHLAAYQAACDGAACPPLSEVAGQQLALRFQQLCSAGQLHRDSSLEQLHATRRAIRRFRYDLEAVSAWLPAPKPALRAIKASQDAFGAVSDTAALMVWLQAHGAGAEREAVAAGLPELVDAALASLDPLLQSELGAMSSATARS